MFPHFLLKRLYASVEVRQGSVVHSFSTIPRGFLIDLDGLLGESTGVIYIREKRTSKTLMFRGGFSASQKQRILNVWGIHKSKYR